jgi:hypothetical protein
MRARPVQLHARPANQREALAHLRNALQVALFAEEKQRVLHTTPFIRGVGRVPSATSLQVGG